MGILKSIRKWSAYHRTYRDLNALDARSLDDIGINRGDIHRLAQEYANRI
ncbi:MAG TPA: DUF1127 domain-containing protein [Devosia sp.]|nr:DUF1127 domain-containing protein [Devosia sp.]